VLKQVHRWFSPHLGKEMPIAVYGHYGKPLLMFPTAAADFEEYERFLVIDQLRPYIDAGIVKVFSINSINRESWMNDHLHPAQRAARQAAYSKYVTYEVAPFIKHDCGGTSVKIATTGASFGAFHAANALFRNPDQFDVLIAMSGSYDIRSWADGFHNDDVYFNNPIEYLQHLEDDYYLPMLRHNCDIHILSGQGAYEAPNRSRDLSRVLSSRGIPHSLDMWGYDVDHDWPWWRRMLDIYIPRLFHAYGPR
jgi:esterase/lipase superfamily enzyme